MTHVEQSFDRCVGCEAADMLVVSGLICWPHIGGTSADMLASMLGDASLRLDVLLPIEGCETFQNHLKESVENN